MSTTAKSLVEKFGEEGLPIGKVAMIFNVGDQTFSNRDCWNHLRDVRGKNLDAGGASAILNYCQKQQAENSNFFYSIQCDDVGHIVNFFWVDARSRMAYQYFGDVVTFDDFNDFKLHGNWIKNFILEKQSVRIMKMFWRKPINNFPEMCYCL